MFFEKGIKFLVTIGDQRAPFGNKQSFSDLDETFRTISTTSERSFQTPLSCNLPCNYLNIYSAFKYVITKMFLI